MYRRILIAVDDSETTKVARGGALPLANVWRDCSFVSENVYANMEKLVLDLIEAGRKFPANTEAPSEKIGIGA